MIHNEHDVKETIRNLLTEYPGFSFRLSRIHDILSEECRISPDELKWILRDMAFSGTIHRELRHGKHYVYRISEKPFIKNHELLG